MRWISDIDTSKQARQGLWSDPELGLDARNDEDQEQGARKENDRQFERRERPEQSVHYPPLPLRVIEWAIAKSCS